eukprot:m.39033 g.39033  ORF g.39033 m.39033 type:complete len:597 (-) comp6833_c0_seq2:1854-3644(-)
MERMTCEKEGSLSESNCHHISVSDYHHHHCDHSQHSHRSRHDRQTLETAGEKCIHLILSFLVSDLTSLSCVSRINRRLYVAVRNLPQVESFITYDPTEISVDSNNSITWKKEFKIVDVYYWCKLGLELVVKGEDLLHFCTRELLPLDRSERERILPVLRVCWYTPSINDFSLKNSDTRHLHSSPNAFSTQPLSPSPSRFGNEQDVQRVESILKRIDRSQPCGDNCESQLASQLASHHVANTGSVGACEHNDAVLVKRMLWLIDEVLGRVNMLSLLRPGSHLFSTHFTDLRCFQRLSSLIFFPYISPNAFNRVLTDLSPLSSLHTFKMSGFKSVTDVASLQNLSHISLAECDGVTDLSALCNLHSMTLSYMRNVTDISTLGRVHTLCIRNCNNIYSMPVVNSMHTLRLDHLCVRHIDTFGRLHTLGIRYCTTEEAYAPMDVYELRTVHTLSLHGLTFITDVSALQHVHDLNLSFCPALRNVECLRNVFKLSMFAEPFTSVACFKRVHTLIIPSSYALTDVSSLHNVHTLALYKCFKVASVADLHNIHTLDIRECRLITDVSMLSSLCNISLCMKCNKDISLPNTPDLHIDWHKCSIS